jgi:hypothetical protein
LAPVELSDQSLELAPAESNWVVCRVESPPIDYAPKSANNRVGEYQKRE